jgi:heterodisulfide reductase subunit B
MYSKDFCETVKMNSKLFFQAKQIKHWMFPCIGMCLQNFEKEKRIGTIYGH